MSNQDIQLSTILSDRVAKCELRLFMPAELSDEQESVVHNICTLAIAGVAVKVVDDLLKNHEIKGVVIMTGRSDL